MTARDNGRIIEGTLSLAVLVLVLFPVWGMVYLGKMRTPSPADALLVNEATATQFAHSLGIESEIAQRLVERRAHLHGFESVDGLTETPLFTDEETARLITVARAGAVDTRTATARLFTSSLGVSPPVARRLAAYRDSLLPSPFETTGQPQSPQRATATEPTALLRHATLLDIRATRPLLNRFLVRTPAAVTIHFWTGAAVFGLIALLLPAWLRGGKRGGDPFLLPLALLLSGVGVAVLFSIKDPLRDRAVYEHHLFGLLFSLIVLVFCARLAPLARSRIRNYLYLWVIAAFVLVAALFLFGSGPEGVKLNLFHFQPVELIKLFLTFFLAGYLADRADLIADTSVRRLSPGGYTRPGRQSGWSLPRRQDIGPVVVMFVVALTLFLVIKDMGPGLLMFGTFVVLLCAATGRGSFLLTGMVLLAFGSLLGYLLHFGVFATRVDMWLHPFANSHPNGMQLGQSYWGLASGGWEGSGPGLGMPGLIPRGGSDLAFAAWGEETGLAGTWLALIVYVVLVWRGVDIALKARSDFDRALAFGLTILLGLQTLLILGGVTGLLPLSGVSLPFMSYGNSALVAGFVVIGLLRGISSRTPGGDLPPTLRPSVNATAKRFAIVYAALVLIGVGALRLSSLQGFKADEVAVRSIYTPDADHVRRAHLNPRLLAVQRQIERGSIYDAEGRVLATSRYTEMVSAGKSQQEARRLAEAHGRLYPFGPALAHMVGYVDPAVGGPFGLESTYNADLRGFAREVDLLKDYRRKNLPGYTPRKGHDIFLTIDARLQRSVQEILNQTTSSLRDTVTGRRKDRAAFVLMRPDTGDIVAAATLPAFDPNGLTPAKLRPMVQGPDADQERPLINRATSGWYPPGSTFKIATTAAALEAMPNAEEILIPCNRVSPDLHWRANGVSYARSNIHDDKGDPDFGRIALPRAFEVSSNIYFANLAVRLDPNVFRERLVQRLGFSHVPKQSSFDADLSDIGYGQGRMLTSPMEMCRLSATVANGGRTMQPRLVTKIDTHFEDPLPAKDKRRRPRFVERPPVTLERGMSVGTAATLRGYMRRVVTNGTARGVFDHLPFAVAGKTGTAQNHQYDRQPHSWFVGFAPHAENGQSKYAFACVVENGGYGKTVAAVICRDVLRKLSY